MKRRTRNTLILSAVVALVATTAVANALWDSSAGADVPDFAVGAVTFAAEAPSVTGSSQISDGGAPVTVTLPGSKIVEVLEQTSVDAEPVIWRFVASGAALGITGLNYSITATAQTTTTGSHNLASGVAQTGTVLSRSTLKLYRAAAGGDCSTIPPTPEPAEGESERNVYLFASDDVELQAAGTSQAGGLTAQEWCVALDWNDVPDGTYVNDVRVTGIADDGSANGAFARWHASVGYPPALDLLGTYRNRALAEATSEDTTKAQASAEWFADVYPDPSGEPSIVFTLDPIVTNLNPAFSPKD